MSYVSHLEAAIDGTRLEARTLQTTHEDRPLWVRYDLDALKPEADRDALAGRDLTMWRYRELMPVEDERNIVSLGEGMSPLLDCPRLARELGVGRLLIKDESQLPTGSFKSRGMSAAVTMAKELGVTRVALPTAGNAGGAASAYAARAGLDCYVFMPDDTPIVNRLEAGLYGAKAFLVDGLINQCGAIVREGASRMGWFDLSTLREPYRIEGKKTMGLELAEQMGWRLPGAIFYPTGGGTGIIGMWKGFHELARIGWLDDERMPKMFSCQSSGCSPIAEAFEKGERFAEMPENPHTVASGLRVPKALGDFMILDTVRESGGAALSAEEDKLLGWMRRACAAEGISVCPETCACLEGVRQAIERRQIGADEEVVVFNTGAAQKYVEAMEAPIPRLSREAVDWELIERS